MIRHHILALSAAATLAFTASPARASGPTEWNRLDKDAAAACFEVTGMVGAIVSPGAIHFSDNFGMDARVVTGRYPQVHMLGAHGTMLCLYDRRTRRAEAQDAAAVLESSPLQLCHDRSTNRIEVGQCLERRLAEANAGMSKAASAALVQAQKLDAVTERTLATSAFDRSQKAFAEFREMNCVWRAAQLSSGTGAGDVARDCMIRMTLGRVEELMK